MDPTALWRRSAAGDAQPLDTVIDDSTSIGVSSIYLFQRQRLALTPASVLAEMVAKANLPAARFSETLSIAASQFRAGRRLG